MNYLKYRNTPVNLREDTIEEIFGVFQSRKGIGSFNGMLAFLSNASDEEVLNERGEKIAKGVRLEMWEEGGYLFRQMALGEEKKGSDQEDIEIVVARAIALSEIGERRVEKWLSRVIRLDRCEGELTPILSLGDAVGFLGCFVRGLASNKQLLQYGLIHLTTATRWINSPLPLRRSEVKEGEIIIHSLKTEGIEYYESEIGKRINALFGDKKGLTAEQGVERRDFLSKLLRKVVQLCPGEDPFQIMLVQKLCNAQISHLNPVKVAQSLIYPDQQ